MGALGAVFELLALGDTVRGVELGAGGVDHVVVGVAANAASVQLVSRDAAQADTGIAVVVIAFVAYFSAASVSSVVHPLPATNSKHAVSIGESRAIPAREAVSIGGVELVTEIADG